MTILIDENLQLELLSKKHSRYLYDAIDKNRTHLSEFLPWVGYMQSQADLDNYIEKCGILFDQKEEISFAIIWENRPVGRIGLHHLDHQNKHASIGYWLTKNAEGKGIITKSCRKLIDYGFTEIGLNRIEIKCALNNIKSQAVPKRLHFTKEGILRGAEYVNNRFTDLILYSKLRSEWSANT